MQWQPKTYEQASLPEKALGKARQLAARSLHKTNIYIPDSFRTVSICFDDFPESAALNAAPILEAAGMRGTFYTCFGTLSQNGYDGRLASMEQVQALAANGHEIACHTYDHVNASFNANSQFTDSCRKNIDAASGMRINLEQFSYPQGGMSVAAKKNIRQWYGSARSGFGGINRNFCDVFCLKSESFYQNNTEKVNDLLGEIQHNGGWLILYTHDVCSEPSPHGISVDALYEVVTMCQEWQLPVMTVGAALKSLRFSNG